MTFEGDRNAALADTVQSVWRAVLPDQPFDPDVAWGEAGVDSLKRMEIAVRIERAAGLRVPFELMTAEVKLGEFLRGLGDGSEVRAGQMQARVFFVPGVVGDGPALADFRQALAGRVTFEVMALPDIDVPSAVLSDLKRTAARLVETMMRVQPEGDLRIAGYSFGGFVAQEATRQLETAGRRVSFLCIIDGLSGPRALFGRSAPGALRQEPGRERDLVFALLCRLALLEVARRRLDARERRGEAGGVGAERRALLQRLRGMALLKQRLRPCAAPTLLIASEDFERYADLSVWRSACPRLRMVTIAAGHRTMLHPPALQTLAELFADGLAGSAVSEAAAP